MSDSRCPGQLVLSDAAGQDFEGGRAVWYKAAGIYSQSRVYVIYNDGTWESYIDTWDSSQPYDDPNISPPAGRYQPVAGIGKVWREQPGVRSKLGWAYGPESPFSGRRQEPAPPQDPTFIDLYIDHGPSYSLALRLRQFTGTNGAKTWIVAGGY